MPDALSDIERARQEHQASMKTLSAVLVWVGLALVIGCVVFAAGPGIRQSLSQRGTDPNGVSGMFAFLAIVAFGAGGWAYYSARPIPNEPLRAPDPYEIITDQPWRRPTNPELRFLERLKDEVVGVEQRIKMAHDSAVECYNSIPNAISCSEYESYRSGLFGGEARKKSLLETLPPLYDRVEKVFNGDVASETLAIKEEIKKLERQKQEQQRRLVDAEKPCTDNHHSDSEVQACNRHRQEVRESLYQSIHKIDSRVIELNTDLEELQNYDFRQLWQDVGLPKSATSRVARLPKESLSDLKDKVEALNNIPRMDTRQPPAPPQPQPSLEQRIAQAEARVTEIEEESTRKQQQETAAGRPLQAQKIKIFYEDLRRDAEEDLKKLTKERFKGR